MTRTLAAKSQALVDDQTTRPLWLVSIGFSTPLLLSSREDIYIGSDLYQAAGLKVNLKSNSIELFNEAFAYSADFMAADAYTTVQVWKAYGPAPFTADDLDLYHDGVLGAVRVGTTISATLRPAPPQYTPRLMAAPPTLNHIPQRGTRIVTTTGVYEIG